MAVSKKDITEMLRTRYQSILNDRVSRSFEGFYRSNSGVPLDLRDDSPASEDLRDAVKQIKSRIERDENPNDE